MLSHDLAGKANKDFYRERLNDDVRENANPSSTGFHILKSAAKRASPPIWKGHQRVPGRGAPTPGR